MTALPDRARMKFDHIGVVVAKIDAAREHLTMLFGIERWTSVFKDDVNGVFVQFGQDASGVCYEAIAPTGPSSPVMDALRTGRILNHVAYLVADLAAAQRNLEALGCRPAGAPKPAVAYGGANIQFFASPLGLIVELIEARQHHHIFF